MTIRAAGPQCAEFLSRLRESQGVQSDQAARLARLVATYGEAAMERTCGRALFFGATDSAARIERILDRGLHKQPLPEMRRIVVDGARHDFGRSLGEYEALLVAGEVSR